MKITCINLLFQMAKHQEHYTSTMTPTSNGNQSNTGIAVEVNEHPAMSRLYSRYEQQLLKASASSIIDIDPSKHPSVTSQITLIFSLLSRQLYADRNQSNLYS